jgi:hypothetical protein
VRKPPHVLAELAEVVPTAKKAVVRLHVSTDAFNTLPERWWILERFYILNKFK